MKENIPEILIKSKARRNKYTTTMLGSVLCLLSWLAANTLWQAYQLQLIFISLIGLLLIVIGLFKYFEPRFCLSLTPEKINYYHRHGQWSIHWDNIQIIHQPKFNSQNDSGTIPYIGIKLRNLDASSNMITPRLANHLIHEQNPLLVLAAQLNEIDAENTQINFSTYKTQDGSEVTGPIAAWLHQTCVLRKLYGCDLYIPVNNFMQSPEQMLTLLKRCQQSALKLSTIKEVKNPI